MALTLATGCAADAVDAGQGADDTSEDAISSRPAIELAESDDPASLQNRLFALVQAFRFDAELAIEETSSGKLILKGKETDRARRSLTCEQAPVSGSVLPSGATHTAACTLRGFDITRSGGVLVPTYVPFGQPVPFAGKLLALLEKGAERDALGAPHFNIRKTGDDRPHAGDRPVTATYEMSDSHASLVCSSTTGGFVFTQQVSCEFKRNESDGIETFKGSLFSSVGIGGENTGVSATIDGASFELVLSDEQQGSFEDGRVARITGARTTLSGVETHNRAAINVRDLLVCPAPGLTVNLKPPVSDDAAWLGENCPGVRKVF